MKSNQNQNQIKRELYFYIKPDNDGLKKSERKRRGVIAGVHIGNELRIAVSSCSHKDAFIKAKGKVLARGRALSTHPVLVQEVTDEKTLVTLFISLAKTIS